MDPPQIPYEDLKNQYEQLKIEHQKLKISNKQLLKDSGAELKEKDETIARLQKETSQLKQKLLKRKEPSEAPHVPKPGAAASSQGNGEMITTSYRSKMIRSARGSALTATASAASSINKL